MGLRTVTVTFRGEGVAWPRGSVHVDGVLRGGMRVEADSWLIEGPHPSRHRTFWEMVNDLANLPEQERAAYGLAIGLPIGEVRSAAEAWGVRAAAPAFEAGDESLAYACYLAGWADSIEHDRRVERAEVERELEDEAAEAAAVTEET